MIPAIAHFVWFGESFPWLNALAIVSAAEVGGFERLVLHTDCAPEVVLRHVGLARLSRFEVRPIDLAAIAENAGRELGCVQRLFEAMRGPAARSDVLRALILAGEGGVYLDMDTVTVSSFAELRQRSAAFVGQERICFPNWTFARPSVAAKVKAYVLSAARFALTVAPRGYRAFAAIEQYYSLAVNNAVLGAEAHHPFIEAYVSAMLDLPPAQAARRFAVGPHLLAELARQFVSRPTPVLLLASDVFYPLAPVISEHWWRRVHAPALSEVLSPDTIVVHWYASVRSRQLAQRVDPDYVRRMRDCQLFSALASRYLHAC